MSVKKQNNHQSRHSGVEERARALEQHKTSKTGQQPRTKHGTYGIRTSISCNTHDNEPSPGRNPKPRSWTAGRIVKKKKKKKPSDASLTETSRRLSFQIHPFSSCVLLGLEKIGPEIHPRVRGISARNFFQRYCNTSKYTLARAA